MLKTSLFSFTIFLLTYSTAFAHTPYMACYDNGDKTISCFAEFSNGGSAEATPIRVVDNNNVILISGKMDELGEFTFKRPLSAFSVIFDAGPGHRVIEKSANIIE